jgi:hypothetical protein
VRIRPSAPDEHALGRAAPHATAGVALGDPRRPLAPAALARIVVAAAELSRDALQRVVRVGLAGDPAQKLISSCVRRSHS